jgi:hypothetical protein
MTKRSSKDKSNPADSKATGNPGHEQATGSSAGGEPATPHQPGLPAPESIVSETDFTSPKGTKYRIIKTRETDPYDKPEKPKRRQKGKED